MLKSLNRTVGRGVVALLIVLPAMILTPPTPAAAAGTCSNVVCGYDLGCWVNWSVPYRVTCSDQLWQFCASGCVSTCAFAEEFCDRLT